MLVVDYFFSRGLIRVESLSLPPPPLTFLVLPQRALFQLVELLLALVDVEPDLFVRQLLSVTPNRSPLLPGLYDSPHFVLVLHPNPVRPVTGRPHV